jgi:hypothetical protein
MKKPTITAPEATDPTPANRIVTGGMVKVRATCHLGESINGVIQRFAPGQEFELPAARVRAIGPLVELVTLLVLFCALTLNAAPVGLLTKSTSGTTAATLLFPGGTEQARVVALDVTSDKAASVVSYRAGTTAYRVVANVAATETNIFLYTGGLTTNDVILIQSASDVVTNATVFWTNTQVTATLLLAQNVGTNLVAGDTIRKFSAVSTTLTNDAAAATTNYFVAATNGLAANDVVAIEHFNTLLVGTIHSVLSNSINLTATLGTNLWPGLTFYKLTNSFPVILASGASGNTIIAANATNLVAGDTLVLSPASGGHFKRTYTGSTAVTYAKITTSVAAGIGVPLLADNHIYLRGGAVTTPVGATTVRLYGGPVFLIPPGRPGSFILDGTSACSINQIIVNYDK